MSAKSKKARFKLSWKLFLVIGLVIVCALAALELTNATHIFHKPKAVSGTIPSTSPRAAKVSASDTTSSSSDPADSSSGSKQNSTGGSGGGATSSGTDNTALLAPSGAFISNHHPNLSGSPAPTQEQSVCNTSPGASCYIKFVNSDGVVKTLASQVADSSGSIYWSWNVKTSGFTEGSWTVTATASLNSQTKSASDSLALEVQP